MFRQRDIEGNQPNKFAHSKRGYQQPLESPYEPKSQAYRPAPLTNNIFSYTTNPLPNNYSPTSEHFYQKSTTRVGNQEIQTQINHPENHLAHNQKALVDEEIFHRQLGKGAVAIDKMLYVKPRVDPGKYAGHSYHNEDSPSKLAQRGDALDTFKQTYTTQNSAGYPKNADNFFGVDSKNAQPTHVTSPSQSKLATILNGGGYASPKSRPSYNQNPITGHTSFDGRPSANAFDGRTSVNSNYSPNNKNAPQFGLDRTQQNPKFHPEQNVSHLIQQKTLNRTWVEAQYTVTNPINGQLSPKPVINHKEGYFSRPNVFGNGVYSHVTYQPRK